LKALILAAGRGSRLNEMTDNQPKCMTDLGDKPLLHWQIESLKAAGATDITVVTGYLNEVIKEQGVPTLHNAHWATTNMVSSLLCSLNYIDQPTIVSYSDIVYAPDIVKKLTASKSHLAVAYDDQWLSLWRDRFDNPLDDAESLKIDTNGNLLEIGKKVGHLEEIEGQYLGLMQFTPQSMKWIDDVIVSKNLVVENMDMTSLLNHLIEAGHKLQGVKTSGNWCEIDTQSDLRVAETRLSNGQLDLTSDIELSL